MSINIEQWDIFELTLHHNEASNPYQDVQLEATFTLKGRSMRVDGFYDGDGVFKIRCMPDQPGEWRYVTRSNVPVLNGQVGHFNCTPAGPNNHGPVRVVELVHFAYEDGTPYYPVGTTCYVWNLQGDELEMRTLKTLERAPFNKMRMGVFPKRYRFNYNEPPSYPFPGAVSVPWNPANLDNLHAVPPEPFWDFEHFNPEYFRHLEARICDLRERGIEADLILFHPYDFGAWGFDRIPADVRIRLLKYLVARLAAYRNLWWSFANEYDLMFDRTMEDWDHDMQLVQSLDPYNHLRGIHNCGGKFYDHKKPWVTHCSIQTHNLSMVPIWLHKYAKPVVIDECGYEGDISWLWGDLSPEEMVMRFWLGFACGGYVGHGETYLNEQDELWWSKGGALYGQSPERIAFLRQIISEIPGYGLLPLKAMEYTELGAGNELFSLPEEAMKILPESWNIEAGGCRGGDTFLFYFGMHQPRLKKYNLPEGQFRIDVIDTWNMTIETAAERAQGNISVELPVRKYMAILIQRVQ